MVVHDNKVNIVEDLNIIAITLKVEVIVLVYDNLMQVDEVVLVKIVA